MFSKAFQPEKQLWELNIFRWVCGIYLLAAAFIFTSITYFIWDDYEIDFKPEDWANFAELYSVPLWFLTGLIPIVALLAANHRSSQSKEQISLSQTQASESASQNAFANYYKHLEEFEKYNEKASSGLSLNNPREVHDRLFYKDGSLSMSVSETAEKTLRINCIALYKRLRQFAENPGENPLDDLANIFLYLHNIEVSFLLERSPPPAWYETRVGGSNMKVRLPVKYSEIFETIQTVLRKVEKIRQFARGQKRRYVTMSALMEMQFTESERHLKIDYRRDNSGLSKLQLNLHDCGESGEEWVVSVPPMFSETEMVKVKNGVRV